MSNLNTLSWPVSRLGEAMEVLARKSRLPLRQVETPTLPQDLIQNNSEVLGRWIEMAAGWLGFEAEPVEESYADVDKLVCNASPALLRLPGDGEPHFLALLEGGGRMVSVLGSDLVVYRFQPEVVRSALCREIEAPLVVEVDQMLDEASVPMQRRARVRTAILRERLSPIQIGGCWLLRLSPSASFWRQMRHARLPRFLIIITGTYVLQYFLLTLSWGLIGRGALEGHIDRGWFIAWVLILLTLIPLGLLALWSQGLFTIGVAGLLKQRLLYGALRLEPEEIRHQGAGQLLGRVIESEAVESLILGTGFLAFAAVIGLVMAIWVLGIGAGGWFHVLLLIVWIALIFFMGWRFFQRRRRWTKARIWMTHDLVERMVGHRTRLAQEVREHWHDGEDETVERYLKLSEALDWTALLFGVLVPRGWLILGVLGLAPAFIFGYGTPATLAIGLGGILLASQALGTLSGSLSQLSDAVISWEQVAPLFHAASSSEVSGSPVLALMSSSSADSSGDKQAILEAHHLVFRYRDRAEPVLQGCSLRVLTGDRLLLEGPSGGGKSTLASLLIGLRLPESGLLLLQGLDRQTLGSEGWRRVVSAPQFHENHVLTGTFAFNLLMGRRWPPESEDLEETEIICRELGLGDLLDRMPAGFQQMVGETGWQLSHGERSRLYIARALLQNADLIILDESFAALDPENLHRALQCVLNRAPTLLVIAHP